MSLFLFLTVVQAIVATVLVVVVLMQRSEGGGLGLGGGGSPAGLMSARGAADFLTRATSVLATLFVVLSIALAAIAVGETTGRDIDDSLDRTITPESGAGGATDLLGNASGAGTPASTSPAAAATATQQPVDPLQGAAE